MSAYPTSRGIVVGVDGSASSTAAVEWAARDAAMHNVLLTLIHVVPPVPPSSESTGEIPVPAGYAQWRDCDAKRIIEDALKVVERTTAESDSMSARSELLHGATVPTLVDFSSEADLLVVGCRGQGTVSRALLG